MEDPIIDPDAKAEAEANDAVAREALDKPAEQPDIAEALEEQSKAVEAAEAELTAHADYDATKKLSERHS